MQKRIMKHVYILRRLYPHWAEHSGIHQFTRYLDSDRFRVTMRSVPMGEDEFRISRLRDYFKKKLEAESNGVYKLNDADAELNLFLTSLYRKMDIVHMLDAEHSLMYLPFWFRWIKAVKKCPKIIAMFHQPPSILSSLVALKACMLIDCIMVLSGEQADFFKKFVPAEKIKLVFHGIDTGHYRPSNGYKDSDKLKCLAAGVWLRDYDAFIETAKLLEEDSRIEFHIVSTDVQIPAEARNIVIHRNITDAALLSLYQSCHVLFMPLKEATANNVLLEGIACGLPVVSSDLSSVKAYLPGDEAVLIKGNDPVEFSKVLTGLMHAPERLRAMSVAARKRAETLSWPAVAEQYMELYLSL